MYKITRENLPALYRALAAERELYLPVRKSGQVNFAAWDEAWERTLITITYDVPIVKRNFAK